MVSVVKRMRHLKSLLNMRVGLGAALLPPAASAPNSSPVTRLHLTYARKIYEGHQGARKFWRICLPRLKFHNPALPVTVKQTLDQAGPAMLSIYFNKTAAAAAPAADETGAAQSSQEVLDALAPAPTESEVVKTIDVKNKDVRAIWAQFKAATGAEDLPITPEDQAEIDEMNRLNAKSELDRKQVAENMQAIRDQEKLLEAAREDVKRLREEEA
ncbi:hypothetical protein FQN52_001277 [Onygenales sp. PD_12]|nr:hypothetical protein FQN53_002462 [Emmonsiellopsis sp. PD_33]KAK2781966.1 hypothetical protein FQN52_001277 [Onygenales sp. PD_12]